MVTVSRRTSTSACLFSWFNRWPSCAKCKRVLSARASVSFRGIVVWCVGRWTYRDIVVLWLLPLLAWSLTVAIDYFCVWILAKLDVLISAWRADCCRIQLLRSRTCLNSCRPVNGCVQALEKPGKLWMAIQALRVESQLVNSLDQFCGQLVRS